MSDVDTDTRTDWQKRSDRELDKCAEQIMLLPPIVRDALRYNVLHSLRRLISDLDGVDYGQQMKRHVTRRILALRKELDRIEVKL